MYAIKIGVILSLLPSGMVAPELDFYFSLGCTFVMQPNQKYKCRESKIYLAKYI